jgi:pimeloyl-ACP methyl ester carboxylesterase
MLGFGRSAPLTSPYSVEDYALWVKKLISECGLNCPHIIAHSFGGRVALKLLSSEKGIAERLVILGGAGLVKPRSPLYMRKVKRYRAVKKLFPHYAERHFGSEEYRTLSPVMRESYKKIVNEDLRGCAAEIKNKTLLIYGSDDRVTPADEEGKIFNGLIEDSRLVITDGGHFCFAEHPDRINGLILQFFTE